MSFHCVFNNEYWYVIGEHYGCEAKTLSHESEEIVTQVEEKHVTRTRNTFGNSDVESFTLKNENILTRLPHGFRRFFPNLIGLQWTDGNLETITQHDLVDFPNLRILHLSNNRLVTLDSDLFKHTYLEASLDKV